METLEMSGVVSLDGHLVSSLPRIRRAEVADVAACIALFLVRNRALGKITYSRAVSTLTAILMRGLKSDKLLERGT